MPQRPTTLKLTSSRCPKAVDFYEAGAPQDRSGFAVGTAAHAVLEAAGLAKVAGEDLEAAGTLDAIRHRVAVELMSVGRDGVDAEPPLNDDAVIEGSRLAVRYIDLKGPEALPDADQHPVFEFTAYWDKDWRPVQPESHEQFEQDHPLGFYCTLDVAFEGEVDEEDLHGVGRVCRDWKSAWPTKRAELDSIQFTAQRLALVTHGELMGFKGAVEFVRAEAVNLRTGAVFHDEVWLEDEPHKVDEWKRELDIKKAALARRPRKASPGPHCGGCPFVAVCEPGSMELSATPIRQLAGAYHYHSAAADEVKEQLKAKCADKGVTLKDALSMGYTKVTKTMVRKDILLDAWDEWQGVFSPAGFESKYDAENQFRAFLANVSAPSKKSVEDLLKVMHAGERETQKALLDKWCEPKVEAHFKLKKVEVS